MQRVAIHALVLLLAVVVSAAGLRLPDGVPISTEAIGAIQPRIAPDGRSIAFSYQGAIWRIPRQGGEMRRLTSQFGFDSNPAWSPDGKRLAYFSGSDFRIVDSDTGTPIPVATKVQGRGPLYFHPDGKRVLARFHETPGLAWVDLDNGTSKQVVPATRRISAYGLSPGGDHIAYATTQDIQGQGEQSGYNGPQGDIWIVPSDGGDASRLLQFRSQIFDLWWGHEGLTVASDLGGAHNDLWTIAVDTSPHGHRITSGQADEEGVSVSVDGRWLVYTDNREGPTALINRDLKTGVEQTISIGHMNFGAAMGTIKIRLVDGGSSVPLTARVSVQQKNGKYFAPVGALYRKLGDVEHFYAARETEMKVPAGHYTVRAFRGIEYLVAEMELEVPAGREVAANLQLKRWTHPQERGWWSGESHIHANYGKGQWYNTPATMRLQIEGEGLNVANMVVANSDTDGIFDREFFRGEPDPVSSPHHILYWNEEFRATLWGHMTFYNLKRLVEPIMTGFKDTTNPWDVPTNADVADHVHLQGGHVSYTHPLPNASDPFLAAYSAKALPVDVALGKIDSLDINGSYDTTVPLWYRLLNCGFRLPASAGTDVFLNRIYSGLPGASRAYVHLEGAFTYDSWVKGLKAGRSFVTNGPMLEFTADGRSIGETIVLPRSGQVRIHGKAQFDEGMSRIELVHNGAVIANGVLNDNGRSGSLDQHVSIEKGGWLGIRAYGSNPAHQAHTSPIYIEIAGTPRSAREDAVFFLEWLDQLESKFLARNRAPTPEAAAHVKRQLDAARLVYRAAADGTLNSGDWRTNRTGAALPTR